MLCRVRFRGFAHPASVLVRVTACLEALAIARTVAFDHLPEFIPVDLSEIVVLSIGIELEIGVRQCEPDCISLRNSEIDEALTQLVVGLSLHAPAHQLSSVRRIGVAWP